MNRALVYLWSSLLRRRARRFVLSLRKPLTLVGFVALTGLVGFLFYFREHKVVHEVMRKENLLGAALVMLCGSLFKGFLQRGLPCEPADVEFLFTSPFTQRQVLFYRLLPNYLFAVVQSLVLLGLFGSRFQHPMLMAIGVGLFQIICFHLATTAAIFGGSLPEQTHYRLRWMMLGVFFLLAALYLRLAWNFRIVPSFCASPLFQGFFYPAVTLPDLANAIQPNRWTLRLWIDGPVSTKSFWQNTACLVGLAVGALLSLWCLFRFKENIFEAALNTTTRAAERRQRLQVGLRVTGASGQSTRSLPLPKGGWFQGVGAIIWKNLVAVRRSRREMLVVAFFVFTYTGFFTALLWIYHDLGKKAGGVPLYEARSFTTGIALLLGMLTFLLQRMFPFDFRRDGPHLLSFRTLPVSPVALALAEVAVPTGLCLASQACGVIPLVILGKFDWPTLALVVLGYPVVSLALNAVWNIHYLQAAAKRMQGNAGATSAVGMVLVVALSFLVLYPAGWTSAKVANLFPGPDQALGFTLAAGAGLGVQIAVDLLLVLAMAQYFQRFEVSREG